MANAFPSETLDDTLVTTIPGYARLGLRRVGARYPPVRLDRRTSESNLNSFQEKWGCLWLDTPPVEVDEPEKLTQRAIMATLVYTEFRVTQRDATPRTKEFLRQFGALA